MKILRIGIRRKEEEGEEEEEEEDEETMRKKERKPTSESHLCDAVSMSHGMRFARAIITSQLPASKQAR